jgi:hypothetical protein
LVGYLFDMCQVCFSMCLGGSPSLLSYIYFVILLCAIELILFLIFTYVPKFFVYRHFHMSNYLPKRHAPKRSSAFFYRRALPSYKDHTYFLTCSRLNGPPHTRNSTDMYAPILKNNLSNLRGVTSSDLPHKRSTNEPPDRHTPRA